MKKDPILLRRAGRVLFWRYPTAYRVLGILRGRGDCLKQDYEVWMGGYPRSANTFAMTAFKLANPDAKLTSHFHIPPFIVNCVRSQKPGIFLIRKPEDAVISWTIYWNGQITLEHCLDYYLDFHRAMQSHIPELFVAPFEVVINDFPKVIEGLNCRFRTDFSALPHDEAMVAECFSKIEDAAGVEANGLTNESVVNRPSKHRAKLKPVLLHELRNSPRMLRKLGKAEELYNAFSQAPIRAHLSQLPRPASPQQAANSKAASRFFAGSGSAPTAI